MKLKEIVNGLVLSTTLLTGASCREHVPYWEVAIQKNLHDFELWRVKNQNEGKSGLTCPYINNALFGTRIIIAPSGQSSIPEIKHFKPNPFPPRGGNLGEGYQIGDYQLSFVKKLDVSDDSTNHTCFKR